MLPCLPTACRYSELNQRWAAYDNWTFSVLFDVPRKLLRNRAVLLHIDGLDTGAACQAGAGSRGQAGRIAHAAGSCWLRAVGRRHIQGT